MDEKGARGIGMICMDSDLVIAILKGDERAKRFLDSVKDHGELCVTSITVFEVTYTTKGRSQKRETILENFLDSLHILDLDGPSAIVAARVGTELSKNGEMVHPMDLLIAGICIENSMTLYTTNIKHFERIHQLKIVDWSKM